jgi:CHAD domain-containing protein
LRKLHKELSHPARTLNPEDVHDLRTRCYRVESTLQAIGLAQDSRGSDLVGALEEIRKKAGKVRDADVMTNLAATLADEGQGDALVQLLENLGIRRDRFAAKLKKTINAERGTACSELKRIRKRIEKHLAVSDSNAAENWSRNAITRSVELSQEIAGWPKLTAGNLHPFRLKVKQFRSVLQLSTDPEREFLDALRETKDSAGEWHDWSELEARSVKVLGDQGRSKLPKQIRSITEDRLQHALNLATSLREKYFGLDESRQGSRKKSPVKIKEPVLRAAAKMAA